MTRLLVGFAVAAMPVVAATAEVVPAPLAKFPGACTGFVIESRRPDGMGGVPIKETWLVSAAHCFQSLDIAFKCPLLDRNGTAPTTVALGPNAAMDLADVVLERGVLKFCDEDIALLLLKEDFHARGWMLSTAEPSPGALGKMMGGAADGPRDTVEIVFQTMAAHGCDDQGDDSFSVANPQRAATATKGCVKLGHSGSPILDSNDDVLGMVVARNKRRVGYVPATVIAAKIRKLAGEALQRGCPWPSISAGRRIGGRVQPFKDLDQLFKGLDQLLQTLKVKIDKEACR